MSSMALFHNLQFFCLLVTVARSTKTIDFEKAKSLAEEAANLIYQRYEYHNNQTYQFFLGSATMSSSTWDLLKLKFSSNIVSENSSFLMTFGGSSVTAGHDNYYHQAYPFVFERRMKSIFTALGVDLNVHNIAMGNNGCTPYGFCYEAQGGDNPDWIGWEQSFNCGKDTRVFEFMGRLAYWNKAILFFSASGGFSPTDCGPSKDPVPWISESWTPDNAKVPLTKYAPKHEDVLKLRELLNLWFTKGANSAGKHRVQSLYLND